MRISRFADPTGTVYRFLIALLIYMIGGFPTLVYALPQGGTISSGAGTIDTSGSSLTVNQTTNKIIINWESFSIGNNESVIFLQPDSSSSALNNVLGTSRTVVEGNLSANGQIVLSNPNGIFISPSANIDVAGLIASTLKISEQDFLDGLYKFSQDTSKPLASILNEGKIRASDFAALIAPSVDNKGVVIANLGTVGLVSGKAATVDFVGDNLIKFTVNEPVEGQVLDKDGNLISDRISNSGSIQANGGQVILSAKNASNIIKNVINMDGVIEAKTVSEKNGRIFLGGGDQGTVRVAGTLNASGEEPGLEGGEITVEGAEVIVAEGSIQAKGTDAKGGNITITGTDWVDAGSTMDVSGETGGDVNITTGGLSLAAPILATGTTGDGGNININTLFKSWEVVSTLLDVSGASGGTIKHFAGQEITTSGEYLAIGTAGAGGSIDVTANTLKFMSNTIDASGTMGGGSIRLGGEYQGGKNLAVDEILNAKFLFMTDAANITAKTTGTDGAGGRVIAWADQHAFVSGHFDVTPGTNSGAGGFVEVSSGETLVFDGSVRASVDDRTGTLLLDPQSITVKTNCGNGFANNDKCKTINRITAFANNHSQHVSTTPDTITDVLDGGTDVELQAYRDITVSENITVSAGGSGGALSMWAGRRITIDENVAIDTDNGALTLKANDCTGVPNCTNGPNRRGSGTGYIWMKSGSSINTGAGDFTATVGTASGSDNIILATVTNLSNADDAQAGENETITLASGAHGTDDFYNGMTVYISSGTGSGQLRTISDYVGSSKVATVSSNWTTNPDSTSDYEVRGTGDFTVTNNGTSADSDVDLGASTVGGNLSVTVTTGAITDSGVLTVAGTSSFTTSTNDAVITLDSANLFTGAVSLSTAGTTGDAALTTGTTALILGTSTVNGDLAVTAGGAVTQSGALTILGTTDITATGNDVTLNSASNDFDSDDNGDTGRLVTITGKDVNIQNSDAFNLGVQTITGNLTIQAGGNIDDGGALTVIGGGTTILIGDGGYVKLNDNDSDYTGPVNVTADGQIVLKDENSIELGTITGTGTFTLTASRTTTGTVTQSGTITIANRTQITNTGGDVTLDWASNDFGNGSDTNDVQVTAANVLIINRDTFELGASTVSGTYTVTAVTGDITDSGTLAITGRATFNTSTAGADITLNETGSTFAAGVSLNTTGLSGNATIDTGTNALILETSSVGGNLVATAGNTITDEGVLTVTGTSSFTTDVDDKDIIFDENHAFTGAVTITTEDSSGSDSDATISAGSSVELKLAASSIEGNLTVTSSNAIGISQTGVLTVEGTSSFTTSADEADIALASTNAFTGAVSFTTAGTNGDVTVVDGGAFGLGASTINGNLSLTAAGSITDENAASTVTGTADLINPAGDSSVDVSDYWHTWGGVLTAYGNHAKVASGGAIKLGNITADGGQVVIITRGDVTQTATSSITSNSDTTITARDVSVDPDVYYDITLTNTSNDFYDDTSTVDELKIIGKDVQLASGDQINMGASTITGNLTLTSSDTITDNDTATVTGNLSATTDANNGAIDMGTLAVAGTITLTTHGTGAATIDNGTANIDIAAASVGGALTLTSGAATSGSNYAIMDSGTVTVGGNLVATTDANSGVINMGSLEVTGSFDLTTHGTGAATVVNGTVLDFLTSGIGGALTAKATTGNITDSNSQVLTVGGNASFQTSGTDADIVLDVGHAITGTVTLNTTGSGGDATLDNGTLDIVLGDGTSVAGATLATSVGGNLTLISGAAAGITDASGETVTVGGDLSATTDASNGVINLGTLVVEGTIALATDDTANNDSATALVVNNCSICSGGVGLNFAASTVEGNLTATATTGNMTQFGALTIKGTSILETKANNATIALDTTTNAFTGALTITTNDDSGANADVTIDGGTTKLIIAASTIDGDLTLQTGNAADANGITDSGTVTVGGNLSVTNDLNNGDIDMDTLAVTGSIALITQASGGNAAVTNATALDLAASTVDGTLGVTASAGDITDSGQLTITGVATFTAVAGQSIYLDNLDASNNLTFGIHTFSGAVTFATPSGSLLNVTVRDSTAFDFGAALTLAQVSSAGGNLIVSSGGNVTQTGGALTIPGTATISAASSTVTLSNSSNNFTGAVSIDALTVDLEDTNAIILGASTVTGDYLVTAAGAVTQLADTALDITGTTTVSASGQNVTLANTSNDFTGAVIITGADVELVDANAIDLGASTISGDYDVLAKAGNITQSGNLTVNNSSKASTFKTEATNGTILCGIDCDTAGGTNAFSGTVKLTTTGSPAHAYIDNGTTALKIANGSSVGGNLTLVSGNASGIIDSGTLTVGGNLDAETDANNGVITLDGLAVSGKIELDTVVVSNLGTGTAQTGSIGTTIKLAAGASTTDDIYNSMTVYISSGTGAGQVRTISDYVGSTKVATISSAWTTVPTGGAGDNTDSDYEVRSSFGDATVVNTTGLDFISALVGGDFAATATTGSITQDSAFNIAGTADFLSSTVTLTSGNIILDKAGNDFVGNVRFIGGAVVIKDSNDINFGIGNSTAAGTLVDSDGNPTYALKVYAGDQITDDVNLFVTGPTVADIGDGNAWFGTNFGNEPAGEGDDATSQSRIDLDNGGHTVDGTWTLKGGIGYTVSSASAVVLTAMDLPGDLRVTTTGGTVTDTGVLSVEGLTVISATDGSGNYFDVTLDGVGTTHNNFQDEIQITGRNVVIKDTNAVELGKSTVLGTYDVTAGGGTVTQNQLPSNPLVITGATTITGTTHITLNNTENNFSSVGVTTTGSDVVLVDTDAIELGASTVTGTYDVTAGGAVTQSGALAITGATTITADSAGTKQAVTLTDASNNFQGAVRVAGAAVQLRDTNDLVLGTTTTTGSYTVTAGGGITDNTPAGSHTEALTIGTTASFTAGDGEAIILNNVDASSGPVHDFSGTLTFAASSGNLAGLTVYAVDAIALAALTLVANGELLPGNLSLQSGTVTQSGAWVVPGTTTISASGSDVTLSNTSNDFGGAVGVTGIDVTLVDANAIDLGASTVGTTTATGTYAVTATAGGDITDSGVLTITGTSIFTAAGGQSILLDESSTFVDAVTFASGGTLAGVSITDSDDFKLQVLTLSGNLVVASGGIITQNGTLTIGGTSSFTTSTNNKIIDLALTNAFTGAFTLSSTGENAHVTIDNGTTAIVITSASVGGNLTLTSGAAAGIIDSGTVTVGGDLDATTDDNSGVINMVNLAVDGSISLTTNGTGNATIVNDAGLNFATSTIGGDLTATATTLNITDSGTLKVTGATIITLGTNPVLSVSGATSATDIYGLTITLDTSNNLFTGGITLRYDNVLTDNTDIDLARQVTFAELDFAIDQNITKIYGSYEEMQDDIFWMYKLFRDSFPEQEQFLEVVRQPQSNQVKLRKIKANTNKNNASEGKEL